MLNYENDILKFYEKKNLDPQMHPNTAENIVAVPMREAVINTIVHSDFSREIPPVFEIFSDRMVFTSYGGLIPGQSELRKSFAIHFMNCDITSAEIMIQ